MTRQPASIVSEENFANTLRALENAYKLDEAVVDNQDLAADKGSTRSLLDLGEGKNGSVTLNQEKQEQKATNGQEQLRLKRSHETQRHYEESQQALTSQEVSAEQSLKDTETQAIQDQAKYLRMGQVYSGSLRHDTSRSQAREKSAQFSELKEKALATWTASEEKVKRARAILQHASERKSEASSGLKRVKFNNRLLKKNQDQSQQNIQQLEREQNRPLAARTILLNDLQQG